MNNKAYVIYVPNKGWIGMDRMEDLELYTDLCNALLFRTKKQAEETLTEQSPFETVLKTKYPEAKVVEITFSE